MASQNNKFDLRVKNSGGTEKTLTFNKNNKVKLIVQTAVNDPDFGLMKNPERPYEAFLVTSSGNRQLSLDKQIDEEGISNGDCILVTAPTAQQG